MASWLNRAVAVAVALNHAGTTAAHQHTGILAHWQFCTYIVLKDATKLPLVALKFYKNVDEWHGNMITM